MRTSAGKSEKADKRVTTTVNLHIREHSAQQQRLTSGFVYGEEHLGELLLLGKYLRQLRYVYAALFTPVFTGGAWGEMAHAYQVHIEEGVGRMLQAWRNGVAREGLNELALTP